MPPIQRRGNLVILQSAQAGAGDGASLELTRTHGLLVEVTGTFTMLTAHFEASIDDGATWHALGLHDMSSTGMEFVLTATAAGIFQLGPTTGLTHFRARVAAGAAPTGSMNIRAATGLW